jgi:hypothetical protein
MAGVDVAGLYVIAGPQAEIHISRPIQTKCGSMRDGISVCMA